MTPVPPAASEVAPLPERGTRVLLDGLPGGPWTTVVAGRTDDVLALAAPRLGGQVVRLPLLRPFLVAYTHREIPCEVDAELLGGPRAHARAPYLARVTGAARRMQRRRAVRVPVNLLVRASLADEADGSTLGAVTDNLSAGGALLRLPLPLDAGTDVGLSVQCGGGAGTLALQARVVRCDRTPVEHRPWRAAVVFLDMDPADEDRLVRFVFERQREVRARDAGLG